MIYKDVYKDVDDNVMPMTKNQMCGHFRNVIFENMCTYFIIKVSPGLEHAK